MLETNSTARPLENDEFTWLMAACGPFEAPPHLAVAVSGGPDSMALALLADNWAESRGGRITALTVDHGLRPESADEVRQVGAWLKTRAIAHACLPWHGDKPKSGIMAAARDARYALLAAWCRDNRVLHLLLGHQAEDQAATFLMRLGRGSGIDGLAGMRPVEPGFPRLVRPLLSVPRDRLKATLAARQQSWIEDPTNRSPAFERNRADAFLAGDNPVGLTVANVALAAESLGRAREALAAGVSAALVATTVVSPLGAARLDAGALGRYEEAVQRRVLRRILLCVGGRPYAPRRKRLYRLWSAIRAGSLGGGKTLGGCRVIATGEELLILREAAAIEAARPVPPSPFDWDNRFRLTLPGTLGAACRIQRIDQAAWRQIKAGWPAAAESAIPARLRWTLPVVWDGDRVAAVPHYGVAGAGIDPGEVSVSFAPRHPLT